jgi:translation initiation factor 2D
MEAEGPDFRKPFKLGAGNLLKSSQLRKMVAQHGLKGDFSAGLQLQKLLGSKCLLYSAGPEPLFFQEHAGGPVFPTLYALWDGNMMLPSVACSDAAFESVARGSALFRPGVLAVSGAPFARGDPVALSVDGRLVAVCKAAMSRDEMERTEGGAVLEPLHAYGDALWKLGSKRDPPDQVAEVGKTEAAAEKTEEVVEDSGGVSAAQMDEILRVTFVRALRLHVSKSDLPMLFSTFYSKCMLPAVPVGKTLNLRQSSFGKIGPFLQQMARFEKVIKVNEKSAGVFEIVEVDRSAPLYRAHKAEKPAEETAPELPPVVECLFSVGKKLLPLFPAAVADEGPRLMSKAEARTLLLARVKELQLLVPNGGGAVAPDEALLGALPGAEQQMTMPELLNVWLDALEVHSRTYAGNVAVVRRGKLKPVSLKEETKARKTVTYCEGLARFGLDADALAGVCANRFAASASVAEGVLQVQGARADELAAMLRGEYRLPGEYVVIAPPKKPKPKK